MWMFGVRVYTTSSPNMRLSFSLHNLYQPPPSPHPKQSLPTRYRHRPRPHPYSQAIYTPSSQRTHTSCDDSPPIPQPSPTTLPPANVPPAILASYPLLADFTNALLEVLNVLRLLAPLEIAGELYEELDGVLSEVGGVLLAYLRQGSST